MFLISKIEKSEKKFLSEGMDILISPRDKTAVSQYSQENEQGKFRIREIDSVIIQMTHFYSSRGVMSRPRTKKNDQTLDPNCLSPELAGKWVVAVIVYVCTGVILK